MTVEARISKIKNVRYGRAVAKKRWKTLYITSQCQWM